MLRCIHTFIGINICYIFLFFYWWSKFCRISFDINGNERVHKRGEQSGVIDLSYYAIDVYVQLEALLQLSRVSTQTLLAAIAVKGAAAVCMYILSRHTCSNGAVCDIGTERRETTS